MDECIGAKPDWDDSASITRTKVGCSWEGRVINANTKGLPERNMRIKAHIINKAFGGGSKTVGSGRSAARKGSGRVSTGATFAAGREFRQSMFLFKIPAE